MTGMQTRKRPSALCGRCGGDRRHRSHPVANCIQCNVLICAKHAVAVPAKSGYACSRCSRLRNAA